VTYNNLFVAAAISSPGRTLWKWLAKRSGRINGMSLKLHVGQNDGHLSGWIQPLQTLSGIPGVQLRLEWVDSILPMSITLALVSG
jgi:hypothetical protein